ncbi:hypothetical protein [Parachlamydia acanthamoebae]|uniref:hypothetical protein n=1 Tax=Parachlamydia acanthamoebae TaxID=83552 RepID=UPI0007514DB1|nr:hypothetical protein [Parachlamydia acanthamoebae]
MNTTLYAHKIDFDPSFKIEFAENTSSAIPALIKILQPFSFRNDIQLDLSSEKLETITPLEQILNLIKRGNTQEALSQLSTLSSTDGTDHLINIAKELSKPSYGTESVRQVLKWNLQLSLQHLHGNAYQTNKKIEKLLRKIKQFNNYRIEKRESYGHSPSYAFIDLAGKTFAILKHSDPEYYNTFKTKLLPEMYLKASVWEHEIIGYEQDQILGLKRVPTTLAVTFVVNQKESHGTIQKFIQNSKTGFDFYNPKGAKLLLDVQKNHVHMLTLSGFIKGIAAGHFNNYLLKLSEDNQKIEKIYEIDLEEMLNPFNKLKGNEVVLGYENIDEERKSTVYKSIITCRMWVLGLPQNAQPFERATLLTLTHPNFISVFQEYHENARNYSCISEDSWCAQLERLEVMQNLARLELEKEEISLTPRDVYFALFGGEDLWKLAEQENYPDLIISNNLVSDPYQHVIKDFSNPAASIKNCKRLEEPREESQEAYDIMNFFRIMQNLEPLPMPSTHS